MPQNYKYCGNCPLCDPKINSSNPKKSKNINYIYEKAHIGPLNIEVNNSSTLLVFEAPGIDEWKKCKPISSQRRGSAGYKFSQALSRCNKSRFNYDITEAIRCFPGTSTETKKNVQKKQDEVNEASLYCMKYLYEDIKNGNYSKIVCFGEVAYRSTITIFSIVQSIGNINLSNLNQCVIHLTHPSANKKLDTDIKTYL